MPCIGRFVQNANKPDLDCQLIYQLFLIKDLHEFSSGYKIQ